MKRVNLAIDFLMFVKDSTSSFIHLVEKYPIQVEILYNIFEEKKIEKDEEGDYIIDLDEIINILFRKGMNTQENEEIVLKLNNIQKLNKEDNNNINNDIKAAENNYKYKENNGNGNSSSSNNCISTTDEQIGKNLSNQEVEKELNEFPIEKNDDEEIQKINIINEEINIIRDNKKENEYLIDDEESEKKNLFKKVEDIISRIEENNTSKNNSNDIIEKIKNLNIETLLNEKNKFTEKEIKLLKILNKLKDNIAKDNNSVHDSQMIDIEFMFNKWKLSFNENYKKEQNYKYLVPFDDSINYTDIEKDMKDLIDKSKLKIFGDDPGNFQSFISDKDILKENQFQDYNEKINKIIIAK